jgi:drug/metabolite transporter (DMT)-like permease
MRWALFITPLFLLAFIRFFFASLLALFFLKPRLRIQKTDITKIILVSLLGVTGNIILFFWGLSHSLAINASIIIASIPIFTLLGSSFFLKEKIGPNLLLAAVFGSLGLFIIIFQPLFGGGFSTNILGNTSLFLSSLFWVGYEILSKQLFRKYSPSTITFYSFAIGSATFLPFALPHFSLLPQLIPQPQFLIGALYGIILTSFLSYFFWQWGLSKIDASRAGFFFYLDPVVGTIASYLLLGERITIPFLLGSLSIFIGLFLAEKRFPYPSIHHQK